MAPRRDTNSKGKRRSKVSYEGDVKTLSEKCSFHPYHQGINKAKSKRGELAEIKFKCFPHVQRHTSAFAALFSEDTTEIEQFLHEGKGGTRRNDCNSTLLQLAASYNRKDVVKLLHNAVNPNAVDRYGQTAAHIVARIGNTDMLELLLSFDNFFAEKKDMRGNTYKDILAAPLFNAVYLSDHNHIDKLLEIGADPDSSAQAVMEDELKFSTPRELAIALNKTSIIDKFSKHTEQGPRISSSVGGCTQKQQYKTTTKGFVSIFSYDSFNGRPDLSNRGSESDANNLSDVFSNIGYNGDIYSSLSAEETLRALVDIRQMEMLDDFESVIFYFTGYDVSIDGSEATFLTSDMKTLKISDVLDVFSEFLCPYYLENKPKIFIFDLCRWPEEKLDPRELFHCKYESDNNTVPFALRSQRKKVETVCIYSSIPKKSLKQDFTRDGSIYNKILCRILTENGQPVTVPEVFDKAKSEMDKSGIENESYLLNYNYQGNFYLNDQ
ncbi:uncharacterized protein [Palaemon carinicauda]|uniref:uncharacterized protein n=1 Tax=Palaemon carinicauda TaxID=392227 RepID=UPI0035B570A1